MSNPNGFRAIGLAGLLLAAGNLPAAGAGAAGRQVDFVRDIRPILTEHCAECHGGVKKKAGLSLISKEHVLAAADGGEPVIVPGDAGASELYRRVSAGDPDDRMPPDEPLYAEEIAKLKAWIEQGAPWPSHWAYQPIDRLSPPEVSRPEWIKNSLDRFVLARLEAEGIEPAPEAGRRTLIRRLSLDLRGLLPSPEEVEAFVADPSPRAYEKLVDQMLASPHFGERWARHWLDEARYADSSGLEKDSPREDAWRYRQWVIDSLNDDMPFDEFTVKQIAGDLLPEASADDRIATAFHLQTLFNLEGGVDPEEDRTKRVTDRIGTVGVVWLGTTIGCIQCHDHPYDPLAQEEFYRLFAFFNNADFTGFLPASLTSDRDKLIEERRKKVEEVQEILTQALENKDMNNVCQRKLVALRKYDNDKGFVRVLYERDKDRRETYVFHRGDFLQPKKEQGPLKPGTPGILHELEVRNGKPDRLDLARWMVSPDNPLTSRVTVNKVWYRLFGTAIVQTLQDFGKRGAAPSHPALLDWLAHWFVHDADWSRKELIRLVVTSATYRQSSAWREELAAIDPGNRLYARQNRIRVEAEIVRDIFLQAGGLLSRKLGGPSVFPPLPEAVREQSYANNFRWKLSPGEDRYRRGMYTFFKRTASDPNLMTFDCPDANLSVAERDVSNSPIQALQTLQNEVFVETARAMSRRLLSEGGMSDESRIERLYKLTVSRAPTAKETQLTAQLLHDSREWYQANESEAAKLVGEYSVEGVEAPVNAAWVVVSRTVMNLDEFITRQ